MDRLFESIKIENGEIKHLEYHQQRVDNSAPNCGINLIQAINENPISYKNLVGVHKLRISYSPSKGVIEITITPYIQREIKTLKQVVCNHIDYSLKREDRELINSLVAQKGECDDILIIKNGYVTDTSFANIIFYKDGIWYTPDTPLLLGTCRARLLEEGKIKACKITPADLDKFEKFKILNAFNSL